MPKLTQQQNDRRRREPKPQEREKRKPTKKAGPKSSLLAEPNLAPHYIAGPYPNGPHITGQYRTLLDRNLKVYLSQIS